MRLSRRNIIIGVLALVLLCLVGVFFASRQNFAVFTSKANIYCHDADTIEVIGTRLPGGEGIWRYHIRADHWEKVPARKLWLGNCDDFGIPLPTWIALEKGSIIFTKTTVEPHLDADGENDLKSLRIIQLRLNDGKQTELGIIAHTPPRTDWDMLPDDSGLWVKEEHPTAHADWVKVLIHLYSFRTHQWSIAYRCPWYSQREECYSVAKASMIRRDDNWLVVFNDADYVDSSLRHPVTAELWVNLTTGDGHLGEPAANADFPDFSPDGRYSIFGQKVLNAPDWPQGSGMVGKTYSLARQIGTLPVNFARNGFYRWEAGCRYLVYNDKADCPVDNQVYDKLTRWLEEQSHHRFHHSDALNRWHVLDATGKEIGNVLSTDIFFIGKDLLTCMSDDVNRDTTNHYYLSSWSGKNKQEIIRTIKIK